MVRSRRSCRPGASGRLNAVKAWASVSRAVADEALPAGREANLHWFRLFVLMHVAVRTFLQLGVQPPGSWYAINSQVLILCCLGGLLPRYTGWATRIAVALLAVHIGLTLPVTANHVFLEFFCLGLLAFLGELGRRESELLGVALRCITLIFFFYSGFQKLLYARYFDGQFLAYVTGAEDRFAAVFRYFLPAEEFARLRGEGARLVQGRPEVGSGPFRVDSVLFLAVSNSVYIFEMLAPLLMLVRKTRVAATLAAIAFIVAIEAGAREIIFGAFIINLLLLFLPGTWNKNLFFFFAVLYAYLAAAAFNFVPMFEYPPG